MSMTTAPPQSPVPQESITLYLGRVGSCRLTPVFLWLGISANWATALWGLLSIANSYVIALVTRTALHPPRLLAD